MCPRLGSSLRLAGNNDLERAGGEAARTQRAQGKEEKERFTGRRGGRGGERKIKILWPPRLPASLCVLLLFLLLLVSERERSRLDDHLGVPAMPPGLHRSSQKWLSAHSLPHG
jgi:hypothetical protein